MESCPAGRRAIYAEALGRDGAATTPATPEVSGNADGLGLEHRVTRNRKPFMSFPSEHGAHDELRAVTAVNPAGNEWEELAKGCRKRDAT